MPEARRVRHLVKGLGPGGAERLLVTQIRHADHDRFRHDVVHLLAHKDHLAGELADAGVPVTCLDMGGTARPGLILRLRRLLATDPVDIVHVHSPVVAAAVRLAVRTLPRRIRPALVGTEHNRWPRHRFPTRFVNRLTIGLADATIAVSDDVRGTIRGARPGTVRTIVHGIDLGAVRATADRAAVRHELGIADDEVAIVCVANLRVEKALDVLVAAATAACAAEPRLRYALVGQGPLTDEVDARVAASGLGDRFLVLGYRDDATRVMSGADAFTLSSRHEGLPVAIMEALALGLPVVATAAGGVPDAVGTAGIVVPVDDVAALAEAHVRLARDESLRADLARRAGEEAERFDAARAVAEIEAVYETVTARAGVAPSSQS